MLARIISGGQTGADQGALDAAIAIGIPHGGWVPKGRLTEAGPLPAKYGLTEMETTSYPKRTEKNIIESDGTLIVTYGRLTGGSALTKKVAIKYDRPHYHIDLKILDIREAARQIQEWLSSNHIEVLNVAGSRETKAPGIHDATEQLLHLVVSGRE